MPADKQRQRLAVALDLARQDIPVFPFELVGTDKVPVIKRWNAGAASTDPKTIEAWFGNGSDYMVGVPTGAVSGIDVVDTDKRHGGDIWYEEHKAELSGTQTHITMRDGRHSLLRHHDGVRGSQSKLAPGVDILGDDNFVAWWPAEGLEVVNSGTIADWPEPLLNLALAARAKTSTEEVALERRLPPSAQTVVTLLDRMPNPLETNRDVYLSVMTGARGCIVALSETGKLGELDADAIRDAAIGWAQRWEGYKGTDELQKWEDDFGRCDGKHAGWQALQQQAKRLVPGYADEVAAEEFRAPGGDGAARAKPKKKLVDDETLNELQQADIPPIVWVIPGYLPEGLTVFAGRPKIGKSWMALQFALAVSTGGTVFDVPVEQGAVFYGAFEDSRRRMQSRVSKVLGEFGAWPSSCRVQYRLAALDEGGLETIETWCKAHPKRRLIVLDVFAKVRGRKRKDEDPYQYDYRVLTGLQALSLRYGVAVVVVHHVRKAAAEDVLDTISGTTGIAGAADTVIVLGRGGESVRLYLRGRDVEETDKIVVFDKATGTWSVEGDFDEVGNGLKGLRRRIYQHLVRAGVAQTPKEIADELGESLPVVQKTMQRMLDHGELERDVRGVYRPAGKNSA